MVFEEAGDEKVAVVVAVAQAQVERVPLLGAGLPQQLRPELLLEEPVGGALIDQEMGRAVRGTQQLTGVPTRPRPTIWISACRARGSKPWTSPWAWPWTCASSPPLPQALPA